MSEFRRCAASGIETVLEDDVGVLERADVTVRPVRAGNAALVGRDRCAKVVGAADELPASIPGLPGSRVVRDDPFRAKVRQRRVPCDRGPQAEKSTVLRLARNRYRRDAERW